MKTVAGFLRHLLGLVYNLSSNSLTEACVLLVAEWELGSEGVT